MRPGESFKESLPVGLQEPDGLRAQDQGCLSANLMLQRIKSRESLPSCLPDYLLSCVPAVGVAPVPQVMWCLICSLCVSLTTASLSLNV